MLMKTKELIEKIRGGSIILPISQLRIVLYNQTWYQIDAMT